jgi:hypothetical protein
MEESSYFLWDFVELLGMCTPCPCEQRHKHLIFNILDIQRHLSLPGIRLALLYGNLKRLASRGGQKRTSTRLLALGRQLKKGGLHQPPFY